MAMSKLLRRGQVELLLNVSRWTLARIIANDPTFPGFFELSPGIEVVRHDRLMAWLRVRELEARVPRSTEASRAERGAPTSPRCTHSQLEGSDDGEHDAKAGPRGADEPEQGSTHHEDATKAPGPPGGA
jgi:hypothetical protein